jgi:hypothetical protein
VTVKPLEFPRFAASGRWRSAPASKLPRWSRADRGTTDSWEAQPRSPPPGQCVSALPRTLPVEHARGAKTSPSDELTRLQHEPISAEAMVRKSRSEQVLPALACYPAALGGEQS